MKITILGCGAPRTTVALPAVSAGPRCTGMAKSAAAFCAVNVIEPEGVSFNRNLPTNDPEHLAQSELLLVTLKAWQVSSAVSALLPKLNPSAPFCCCTTAWAPKRSCRRTASRSCRAPPPTPRATKAAPLSTSPPASPTSARAHLPPSTSATWRKCCISAPDVAWHNNIASANWRKLAVNCVINPLTALYGCRNGDLQRYPEQIETLCREVASVMAMEGYHTSCEGLMQYVMDVIRSTADNVSSMLQDIRNQRHTEIDYITGYLRRAQPRPRAAGKCAAV